MYYCLSAHSLLGVAINKNNPRDSYVTDLHYTYNEIKTGVWNIEVTYNAPIVEGYTGGMFIWIPTGIQEGKNYGFVIATALTSNYDMKYFIAAKWYNTWGDWKEI